jgi:hypothetical protein
MLDNGECEKALWKLDEYFDFFEKIFTANSKLKFITEE